MKRADLLRHLAQQGCELLREGGRHTIYWNPANRRTSAVPRHSGSWIPLPPEICKDLGVAKPGR